MRLCIIFVTVVLGLTACKIRIPGPAEGGVVQANGSSSFDCLADETCDTEVSDQYFRSDFTAIPDRDYYFKEWKKREGSLCGGSNLRCKISTDGFGEYPALMDVLATDSVFYLEPVFEKYGPCQVATTSDKYLITSYSNCDASYDDLSGIWMLVSDLKWGDVTYNRNGRSGIDRRARSLMYVLDSERPGGSRVVTVCGPPGNSSIIKGRLVPSEILRVGGGTQKGQIEFAVTNNLLMKGKFVGLDKTPERNSVFAIKIKDLQPAPFGNMNITVTDKNNPSRPIPLTQRKDITCFYESEGREKTTLNPSINDSFGLMDGQVINVETTDVRSRSTYGGGTYDVSHYFRLAAIFPSKKSEQFYGKGVTIYAPYVTSVEGRNGRGDFSILETSNEGVALKGTVDLTYIVTFDLGLDF